MQSLFSPLEKIYKALYLLAYDITGNYGIALILLSFFTFVVLYPFNKKAQQIQNKEHKIQAVLAPQIESLKKLYKGQEQYEKLQRLYYRYGYHPVYAIRSAIGFIFQIPFLTAAYYMLSGLEDIRGVSWGIIPNLGVPDGLFGGVNLLPFVMTMVTIVYAFAMPRISKKERKQTVLIGLFFLVLLYSAPAALLIFWTCNLFWSLLDSVFGRKLHWAGEYLEKKEAVLYVVVALALTIGVFIPADIYINNAEQLWFGFSVILKYFFTYILKYAFILLLIYVVVPREKIKCAYLALLIGILLGVFLQSYVIGLNYGTFDGHEIRWKDYTTAGIINTLVWLACIIGSLIVTYRLKFDRRRIIRFVKPIAIGIILVQCVVLFLIWTKNPVKEKTAADRNTISVLTTKNMFKISTKQNIVIFLLDGFDTSIFEEMMKKEPEIMEKLRDFTFYPDTTSVYGFTTYSLPQILTGEIFNGTIPFSKYFEKAWMNTPYYKYLESKNYDVGIYTNGANVHTNANFMNLEHENIVFSIDALKSFRNIVLFRSSPHFLKKRFYQYNPNEWITMLKNQKGVIYREDDRLFYSHLRKGITCDDKKNSFRFYHLVGAHAPYIMDRNIKPVKMGTGSQYEQSVGSLKIVLEYIEQMKQKRIFDDSTFVIMADHGHHNTVGRRALLCIKYPGDKNNTIRVSNESVSFSRFLPMIIGEIDGNEIKKDKSVKERVFYQVEKKAITEYKIIGNAKNIESWKKVKVVSETNDKIYTLGTTLKTNARNRENGQFLIKGWANLGDEGLWSFGSDSEFQFRIKDYPKKDLRFEFCANVMLIGLPYRTVSVYANKKIITKLKLDNKNTVHSFNIPSSLMTDNLLNIRFNIDHVVSHPEIGDSRPLGIWLKWFKINTLS